MKSTLIVFVILLSLSAQIFGQVKHDSIEPAHVKSKSDITKYHYGIYGSVCATYNPAGIFFPIPSNFHALGAKTTYSFSDMRKFPGIGGTGGVEFLSKEIWRWYRTISIGISYYSYACSATQTASQYLITGITTTSQSDVNSLFNYLMVDFSFRNYIRIIETHTQRLGAGVGATVSVNTYNNTPENYPVNESIPGACLFISGNLRYDISIEPDETIAIEPYYNYEIRIIAQSYPELASFGLKLSLLFE